MARAFHLIFRAVVLLAGLTAAHAVVAGSSAKEGDRRLGSSIILLTNAQPAQAQVRGSSNGVGIAPSKAVVSNPYNVPLLQNAGSLRSVR